jgi:hypothetical protein
MEYPPLLKALAGPYHIFICRDALLYLNHNVVRGQEREIVRQQCLVSAVDERQSSVAQNTESDQTQGINGRRRCAVPIGRKAALFPVFAKE